MRFLIVNTVDWDACRGLTDGTLREEEAVRRVQGCTWLFRASAAVDDPEEAMRDAVREFFASEEGRRVLKGEDLARLDWEAAIPWVPDEVWDRFGLEAIRHPEVQRVILDGSEDLAESLRQEVSGSSTPPSHTRRRSGS